MTVNPHWTNGVSTLYHADARQLPIADESVHCVITSPPYFGQRDYNIPNAIGFGQTLQEYVADLVAVFREVRRVLRPDGTVWLNLGDSYNGSGGAGGDYGPGGLRDGQPKYPGRKVQTLKPKDLIGIPWRVALALQDDSWWLRSAIVWHKPSPMPESVTDRPTNAYEMVFLLSKQGRYFYDADAVREPLATPLHAPGNKKWDASRNDADQLSKIWGNEFGANARNIWKFSTQGRSEPHYATFPDELPRRCILAGTSAHGVCSECGAPGVRQVETTPMETKQSPKSAEAQLQRGVGVNKGRTNMGGTMTKKPTSRTIGWNRTCDHESQSVPATVLDIFVGSGTTCAVAQKLGRRSIGIDANAEYLELARKRIEAVSLPMLLS